jgi:hypothetical protein
MEDDQRVIIRFLCKERVSPEDIHAPLEAQFRDATDSERSVWRWCHVIDSPDDRDRQFVGRAKGSNISIDSVVDMVSDANKRMLKHILIHRISFALQRRRKWESCSWGE